MPRRGSRGPRDPYGRFIKSLQYWHNRLRKGLKTLIEDCEALRARETDNETAAVKLDLYSATAHYLDFLDEHHSIEDADVFPILAVHLDTSKLEADHTELESHIEDIRHLVQAREAGFNVGLLHVKLLGLRDMVFPHMLLEESMMQPAALKAAGVTEEEASMLR